MMDVVRNWSSLVFIVFTREILVICCVRAHSQTGWGKNVELDFGDFLEEECLPLSGKS